MILAIVQARMASTRLPGKVLKTVKGKALIGILLERLKRSRTIDKIVLATTIEKSDDELYDYVKKLGVEAYRGDENDVLDRFYKAARAASADTVVRITGDCAIIDYKVVDKVVEKYLEGGFDYVSNVNPPTYPDGLDAEVFSFAALETAWKSAKLKSEREHVTPYIINSPQFKKANVSGESDHSKERWTVDNDEDFVLISKIIEKLYTEGDYFDMQDVLKLEKDNPDLFEVNKHIARNEGLAKSLKNDAQVKKKNG